MELLDPKECRMPIMMTLEDQAVIEASVAYVDQLCSFNDLTHPEVVKRRRQIADAVDAWHNREETRP